MPPPNKYLKQVAVVEDLAALPSALLEVKPTMLYSVPTLFKRVYDKIQEKVRIGAESVCVCARGQTGMMG